MVGLVISAIVVFAAGIGLGAAITMIIYREEITANDGF